MTPAREQVANEVNIHAWNIYRKEQVFYQAEVLVDFQIEERVNNQIDIGVKRQVWNKLR